MNWLIVYWEYSLTGLKHSSPKRGNVGSNPTAPAMIEQTEYSTWVIEHSVLYLYGIDWVYDIDVESPRELEARMRLHDN